MNPYDFVRIEWNQHLERRPATLHHRFEGLSGRIEGRIKTLTPLFIPSHRSVTPKPYITNGNNVAIIPGTTLKGLMRSIVETIGPGCWWLFKGIHENKLPKDFQQCKDLNRLCVACRMFGLIQRSTLLLGNINFEDAVCDTAKVNEPIFTPILNNPKPEHTAWYLDTSREHVAGRKFYFHNQQIITASELRRTRENKPLNQHIVPIAPTNIFRFSAQFSNLAQDELALLLYALVLEPTVRHKVGYAKPAGLGSIEIELTQLDFIDYSQRYTASDRRKTTYIGETLNQFLSKQIDQYTSNATSVTLLDLRRIWSWPPPSDITYGYPTREWFNENSQAPISSTIHSPVQ